MTSNLTRQQRTIGELYVWIHRRAEYVRQQQPQAWQQPPASEFCSQTSPTPREVRTDGQFVTEKEAAAGDTHQDEPAATAQNTNHNSGGIDILPEGLPQQREVGAR